MVDEAASVVGALVSREEPEADGKLRAVEDLAGEFNHAVHEASLNEGPADVCTDGTSYLLGTRAAR